jgi:hypothetical protein
MVSEERWRAGNRKGERGGEVLRSVYERVRR